MPDQVLIFAPVSLWEMHHSQAIEIAWNQIENGKSVIVVHCESSITSCHANPKKLQWKCEECIFQSRFSIRNHFPSNVKHVWLDKEKVDDDLGSYFDLTIRNHEQLAAFRYDNLPFGQHVAGQLVSDKRDIFLSEYQVKNQGIPALVNMIQIYRSFSEIFQKSINRCFIWNGRRAAEVACALAAQKYGIKTQYFELGANFGRYLVSDNSISSIYGVRKEIEQWRTERETRDELNSAFNIGRKYLLGLREGRSSTPHYKNMLNGYNGEYVLPKIEKSRILVLFTSSAWEFAASSDDAFLSGEFRNQYDLYKKILSDESILQGFEVIVRWHPNLKTAGINEVRKMNNVIQETNNVRHILPQEQINSYSIIKIADYVVSVGSTIGIEASFLGKPSIVLGNAEYSGLGSVYEPKDYQDFVHLLDSKLEALGPEGALIWADWRSSFGTPFRHITFKVDKYYMGNKRVISRSLRQRIRRKWFSFKHSIKKFIKAISNAVSKQDT